jgi:hypothetical protein
MNDQGNKGRNGLSGNWSSSRIWRLGGKLLLCLFCAGSCITVSSATNNSCVLSTQSFIQAKSQMPLSAIKGISHTNYSV